ncbi:hypothetical protein BV22DRAFT_30458 [Leucogyrophana mollusca]|uniref:Uncharacterized protein n=1 Tax=Leucogyrophana mollusca TaxID=85980 RepID=A0ACB8C1K0_9AGAM|nr:hypothetical protein BV22DRAFT_30458 [Leucogyrophana mollusca]
MVYFSRPFLQQHLGGGSQVLIVEIRDHSATPLAKKYAVRRLICPTLKANPWAPEKPGMNGYMFVGLGNEENTFIQPEERILFVGLDEKKFMLAGKYEAKRVAPLTVMEWASLSAAVRKGYCEATKRKNKDSRSIEEIHHAYDIGELKVPCVLLTCLEFDEKFYFELKAKKAVTPPSSGPQACKRRRGDDGYDVDQGSQVIRKAKIED